MAILRGQKATNDCGPTCFANALNMLGYDIKIVQANELCGLKKDGTDSFDIIKAFSRYGFEGKEKIHYSTKRAWSWLMKDTSRGLPIILSVDNDTHWVLVLRAGKNSVQIFDPDDDYPKKIDKDVLLERWAFYEDRRDSPRFHGLKITPFKDKSIKAVILREKVLSTIDVS